MPADVPMLLDDPVGQSASHVPVLMDENEPDRDVPPSSDSDSSSSSSSEDVAPVVFTLDADEARASSSRAPAHSPQVPRPATVAPRVVEGVSVLSEIHDKQQQYYRRLVRCPYHPKCRKARNSHTQQTMHLGECEPVCYLGVWLRRGATLATKAEHKLVSPSLDEVREYARELGLA